jgi:hypothetical protein
LFLRKNGMLAIRSAVFIFVKGAAEARRGRIVADDAASQGVHDPRNGLEAHPPARPILPA